MRKSHWLRGALIGLVLLGITCVVHAREITLEERLAAQNAIEQVYWSHREWPQENRAPKPSYSDVVSPDVIADKVVRILQMSKALETLWARPIMPTQLQSELNRMARATRNPERLSELYDALGNDPTLIAETLARPSLVERLIHDWYAGDVRYHGDVRDKAREELSSLQDLNVLNQLSDDYHEIRWVVSEAPEPRTIDSDEIEVAADEWEQLLQDLTTRFELDDQASEQQAVADLNRTVTSEELMEQIPTLKVSPLREERTGFRVTVILEKGEGFVRVAEAVWRKRGFDAWWSLARASLGDTMETVPFSYSLPSPATLGCDSEEWTPTSAVPESRRGHTAIWTGTEMIVWGGRFDNGGVYNPTTDSWRATSTNGAPSRRLGHTAVWTGTRMLIWGGSNGPPELASGGSYDPLNDSWTALSEDGAPQGRFLQTAVWTGSKMIVWGGLRQVAMALGTGGVYDPATDSWSPVTTVAAPTGRFRHAAVWTGNEMIVWGGAQYTPFFSSTGDGARYDPETDTWTPVSMVAAPTDRYFHSGVWTGDRMIVWGGIASNTTNSGGVYDPIADSWSATSMTEVPSRRYLHAAIWTGTEMIVWSGFGTNRDRSGGRYNPASDSWVTTSKDGAPAPRGEGTAVWTGEEMIVWGGEIGFCCSPTNTGGRYNPQLDSWIPTSLGASPIGRSGHTSVWTGTEMIVWGGKALFELATASGGRYDPTTDSWVPTSQDAAPERRYFHRAVWTGTEMLVWGGLFEEGFGPSEMITFFGNGGRYDPFSDSWQSINLINAPVGRYGHSATWIGDEWVVYGGRTESAFFVNSGGRYNPNTDSWTAMKTTPTLTQRRSHTAVWTGNELIVWGGSSAFSVTGDRYNLMDETWTPVTTTNAPEGRFSHRAIWTGREMIVWGGFPLHGSSNTGGRYDPTTDSWETPTMAGAPIVRAGHSAVWTGGSLIVWGGSVGGFELGTGARYRPSSDAWTPMTELRRPTSRAGHTAVWTGSELIVWGGSRLRTESGGRYCFPETFPPFADAGLDAEIECEGSRQSAFTLVASASTDADSTPGTNDDIVAFDWFLEFGTPSETLLGSGEILEASIPFGMQRITLRIQDTSGEYGTDEAWVNVVDTLPPTVDCPADAVLECSVIGGATLSPYAATTSDVCGATTVSNDFTSGGADASGVYPPGITDVQFTVTDQADNNATCTSSVTVSDSLAPIVTVQVDPNSLWPPNHRLLDISVDATVVDLCDDQPVMVLASIVSSEPDDVHGGGDGHTSPDVEEAEIGTLDLNVLIRAERQGGGDGRSYTLTYQATDITGNTGYGIATVLVPHDRGGLVDPIDIRVDQASSTFVRWAQIEELAGATFDVVRGKIHEIGSRGSWIDMGPVECIAEELAVHESPGFEDTSLPLLGQTYFYLVQYHLDDVASSYGSESTGRERRVRVQGGGCE